MKAIIGRKVGMSQIFDEKGHVIPVTVIEAGPCVVVQKKTVETDGYDAVQLGFGDATAKRTSKPMQGHFKKADVANKKYLREFRLADMSGFSVGDVLKADTFAPGDVIDVAGTSKGKGTAGVMKRHNFKGAPASHGAHRNHRKPGSIGACATPGRIFKGQRMAGRMGGVRRTIQNLTIQAVDTEKGLLLISGAIPGPKNAVVLVRSSVKGA